ncbi:hypothetical protein I302_100941 [Kwoniella bestiolae CBS 10118]|uniref:Uncharacterized protein n=1 Tax=Kwoniella bestiolae CBS 10118 TaxID=1296100 RepID=A0A1B9G6K2_9TREE|nr:hypothetical protein I302_04317 [Kwoniella bestiolae CBS 10118]OCF26631.1 hypothetical protein I302_04317 [Kwoniella bestiolae CBS 10118]
MQEHSTTVEVASHLNSDDAALSDTQASIIPLPPATPDDSTGDHDLEMDASSVIADIAHESGEAPREDLLQGTSTSRKQKPTFLGTGRLVKGIKSFSEYPEHFALGRLTWEEGAEPSEEVKDFSRAFDYEYYVPSVKAKRWIPIPQVVSDHTLPKTWSIINETFSEEARTLDEDAFFRAWERFRWECPEKSEMFDVKFVPVEVYASAHPDPAIEHPNWDWKNKGVYDFDSFEREVEDFYADGVEGSKEIVLTTSFLKKGAYLKSAAGTDTLQETPCNDKHDHAYDLCPEHGGMIQRYLQWVVPTSSAGSNNLVLPEIGFSVRLASIPGYTASKENHQRSLDFSKKIRNTYRHFPGSISVPDTEQTLDSKKRAYNTTRDLVNREARRLKDYANGIYKGDATNANHFTYLHLPPQHYQNFGDPSTLSHVSYEQYKAKPYVESEIDGDETSAPGAATPISVASYTDTQRDPRDAESSKAAVGAASSGKMQDHTSQGTVPERFNAFEYEDNHRLRQSRESEVQYTLEWLHAQSIGHMKQHGRHNVNTEAETLGATDNISRRELIGLCVTQMLAGNVPDAGAIPMMRSMIGVHSPTDDRETAVLRDLLAITSSVHGLDE